MVVAFRFLFHFSLPIVVGLFSGATTNTPSLAAGQAALQNLTGLSSGSSDLLGMAYAIAYPFGVVGIILTMLLIQKTSHIGAEITTEELDPASEIDSQNPDYIDLEVTNPNCEGIAIRDLPFSAEAGIVFPDYFETEKSWFRKMIRSFTLAIRFDWLALKPGLLSSKRSLARRADWISRKFPANSLWNDCM